MTKRRLGELLRAEGLLTDDQLRAALEEQRKSNLFLGEALVKLGFVSEEVIAATIVQQFNLPFISANQFTITPDVLNTFPERMYFEYQFLAVDRLDKTLVIVGAGLMNHDVLDELERLSGCRVCQYVSTWKDIKGAIDAHARDFTKESSELSSLGSMLLDSPDEPKAPATPIAAAKSNAGATAVGAQAGQAGSMRAAPPAPPPPPAPGIRPAASISARNTQQPPPASAAPTAPPAPQSPRLSTFAGVKPPAKTSNNNLVAVPNGPKPAKPATNTDGKVPPASGGKTGLLGLFKKG
jgi:hypothetical protein